MIATTSSSQGAPAPRSDLVTRLVWGVLLAVVGLAAAYAGGLATLLMALLLAGLVAWEWVGLTIGTATAPALATARSSAPVVASLAIPVMAAIGLGYVDQPLAAIALVIAAALIAAQSWGSLWVGAGALYAGALGLGVVLLRDDEIFGRTALLFVFAVVWASDTGAYFAGRIIGGPKLWPKVSPKKTWAGFIGGTAAGVVAGLVLAAVDGVPLGILLGFIALLLSLASAAGDLFESAVKRRFGAKDSGTLIPGHGGIMDRVDGLTFAIALAALIGGLHGRMPASGLLLW